MQLRELRLARQRIGHTQVGGGSGAGAHPPPDQHGPIAELEPLATGRAAPVAAPLAVSDGAAHGVPVQHRNPRLPRQLVRHRVERARNVLDDVSDVQVPYQRQEGLQRAI